MIGRVVRAGGELPHAVGELDRKAVVQVPGQHEHRLAQVVPEVDHVLALPQEGGPRIVLVGFGDVGRSGAADVRDREVHRGDDEEEIGIGGFHRLLDPSLLLLAQHGAADPLAILGVVHHAIRASVQIQELGVGDTLAEVGAPPDRIDRLAIRNGGRPDAQPVGVQDLDHLVHLSVRNSALIVRVGAVGILAQQHRAPVRRAPVHV